MFVFNERIKEKRNLLSTIHTHMRAHAGEKKDDRILSKTRRKNEEYQTID